MTDHFPRALTLAALTLTAPLTGATGAIPTSHPSRHPRPAVSADTAVFAGGCFWGVEGVFEHVKGVISVTSGYAGGSADAPHHEDVSLGSAGHAESVRVVFDPSRISYAQLLQVFFLVAHDPTELDRQGPDVGAQYRSLVLYRNAAQRSAAEAYIADLTRTKVFGRPIVTRVQPLGAFYIAEAFHQHFMALHPDLPYIVYNDAPKLVNLRQRFPEWYQGS